jgi:hypothetical protein
MINRMLRGAGKYAGAISPIEIFNAEQWSKLGSSGFRNNIQDATAMGVMNIKDAMSRRGKEGYAGFKNYFEGYNVGEEIGTIAGNTMDLRRRLRLGTAMGAGLYAASSLTMGSDSLVPKSMRTAAKIGIHGTIAAGLTKAHPAAGAAYAGWGILNMTRRGDNMGPF